MTPFLHKRFRELTREWVDLEVKRERLERAVAKAMAKDPASRFDSAAAFAEALTTEQVVDPVGRRRLAVRPASWSMT